MSSSKIYHIAVLPGDGIGPEVTDEAIRVLKAASSASGFSLAFEQCLVGGAALDACDDPLPDVTLASCRKADAVLLGAVGGPAWDDRKGSKRPERGLLKLRKGLGVFANLRPVGVSSSLAAYSPLRAERVAGTDVLIVRELTGGIYFGEPRGEMKTGGERVAANTMRYAEQEIARLARLAFTWAERRAGRVTSVDKANVLEVSQLWRDVVTQVRRDEYPHITLNHLYVDNAAMQLMRDPRQFDVVVTGNLFGDILSDLAATLPGSLGLLPSASVGGQVGLFEPVHGSAPDIAGQGKANPIGAILSSAMLLDELGEAVAARAVRRSVAAALDAGFRTADLTGKGGSSVSTSDMGDYVANVVIQTLSEVVQ
ncbi:MAG: 3-isopropylmalate dehydrogenase [Rhodothermales bacterium]